VTLAAPARRDDIGGGAWLACGRLIAVLRYGGHRRSGPAELDRTLRGRGDRLIVRARPSLVRRLARPERAHGKKEAGARHWYLP
jgi:hypothetical protein